MTRRAKAIPGTTVLVRTLMCQNCSRSFTGTAASVNAAAQLHKRVCVGGTPADDSKILDIVKSHKKSQGPEFTYLAPVFTKTTGAKESAVLLGRRDPIARRLGLLAAAAAAAAPMVE
jgi:hypothetical protein